MRSRLISAVLASFILLAAPCARAQTGEISFCNEFPHKIFVAIAYLQTDVNNYLSRGWLEVETGKCYVFDTAIRVPTFYYRAESETYREGKRKFKMNWGDEKQFAVRDANFQSYNAEKVYSGMHMVSFSKAPEFARRRTDHGHCHINGEGNDHRRARFRGAGGSDERRWGRSAGRPSARTAGRGAEPLGLVRRDRG